MIVRVPAVGAVAVTVGWRAADLRSMDVEPLKVAHFDSIVTQILPRSPALLLQCSSSKLIRALIPLEAELHDWHFLLSLRMVCAVYSTCTILRFGKPAMRKRKLEAQRNGRAAVCTYVFLVCSVSRIAKTTISNKVIDI